MSSDSYRKTHIGAHALHPTTQMMSYGYDPFMSEGAVKPPVFLTSTFVFRSAEESAAHFDIAFGRRQAAAGESGGLVYSRFNHPNLEIVEDRLALLDGGQAAAVTASGMAAIATTFMSLLEPGDVVVQSTPLYGGTETLLSGMLANWGIRRVHLPVPLTEASCRAALDRAAALGRLAMIYIETPANPTNAVIDFALLNAVLESRRGGDTPQPVTVCDNTLLGPLFQQPCRHGIDLSVYSLTKYVGGHSDLVAGAITGRSDLLARIRRTRSGLGTQLDPHTSWMLARSMETLSLRMQRAADSAEAVADWLAANPYLPCRVLHPAHDLDAGARAIWSRQCSGSGSTFSFVVEADRARAFRILNGLRLFKLAVSLGGTESLVCHPASTTHSSVPAEERASSGVSEGLIRVSIGLEEAADLIADLDAAFAAAG